MTAVLKTFSCWLGLLVLSFFVIAGPANAQAFPASGPSEEASIHLAQFASGVRPQAPRTGRGTSPISQKPYFVEFRARSALSYGHTFAAFGRRAPDGSIRKFEVAGLHPATESPVPWMVGHIIAVPAETGPSDGDLEEQYVTARYRVDLSEAEYKLVLAEIRRLQQNSPMWHAVIYNCNAFVADIGRFMGLTAPQALLFPDEFINGMREQNAGRVPTIGAAAGVYALPDR
ncbi:MAG: hypothetical protein ACRDBH_08620 [Bosea sp. (in: a-proteobacteria)]